MHKRTFRGVQIYLNTNRSCGRSEDTDVGRRKIYPAGAAVSDRYINLSSHGLAAKFFTVHVGDLTEYLSTAFIAAMPSLTEVRDIVA